MTKFTVLLLFFVVIAICDGRYHRRKRSVPTPHEIQIQTIGNTIKLDWSFPDTRSDVTFLIKYRKKNNEDWITVRTPQKSLQLSHLEHSTSYEIQILAQTQNGVSHPSAIIQVPISDPPRPAQPRRQETASIQTPRTLEATLNSQDTVHLHWEPVNCGQTHCSYEVVVKQQGSSSEQVFKYNTNSAVIGKMTPGKTFVFQVRAVSTDGQTMSFPQTSEVRIPTGSSSVVIAETIQIQPVQDQPKSLKVTWTSNPSYRNIISGYKVYYTKDKDSQDWQYEQVRGSNPEAVLDDLDPSSPYFIRVVTEFSNGNPMTTSQTYRFTTPDAPLIKNIKLIYNSDQTMRLEWILHDHVDQATLDGAQVRWTNNRNLAENQWRVLEARRGDKGITLPEKLEPNRQYYFKILPRVRGKGLANSNTIFEIMTRPHSTLAEMRQPDNYYDLRFVPRRQSILIQWTIPADRVRDLTGINIRWSYDRSIPQDRWNVVRVQKEARRAIIEGLDTTKTIFFSVEADTRSGPALPRRFYRIVPTGTNSNSNGMRVPDTIDFETNFPGRTENAGSGSSSTSTTDNSQHLARQNCLRGCTITTENGRSRSTGCQHTDYCVEDCGAGRSGCGTGWCMPRDLVDAAKRHT